MEIDKNITKVNDSIKALRAGFYFNTKDQQLLSEY